MSEPQGLTRRSLLGAALTSVATAAVAGAGLLSDVDRPRRPLRLVVDQHDTRLDRHPVDEVLAASERGELEPFTFVGMSVPSAALADLLGQVRVSVRRDGAWSEWTPLPYTPDEGPDDPSAARVTHPLWTDRCDGLRLDLPPGLAGHATLLFVRETERVIARHSDMAPIAAAAPRPVIRPRSDWGARKARKITTNRDLKLAIVHHSAGGNSYTPGQVPGIIKGIQNYHLDGQGWDDIAYNFLVDKYGGIWEGREGGVTNLIRGGHTAGFNTDSVGVCILGDHTSAVPTAACIASTAAIVAWKLDHHGRSVIGTVPYTAGTGAPRADFPPGTTKSVPVLTMHGDLGSTACPGGHLRSRIPTIRQQAFARQLGLTDVSAAAYYASPVAWLVAQGITTGVGDTGQFKPDDPVDRAQMVTFLWRMMGKPGGFPAHGFPDVPTGSWYDQAVRWAKARGITTGVGGTNRFAPKEVVNRAQMVVFLHRVTGRRAPTRRHGFPDVPSGSWYDAAVSWASEHGITTGVGDTGRFQPLDPVTRGQMAAFLHRTASRAAAWTVPLPPTAP